MLKKLALAFSLAGSVACAENVSIETYRGEVSVAKTPETVVVFDIAALDSLDALGVQAQGTVGKRFVSYLDDIKAENVGSLFEPDMEAVLALNPDLIVVGGRSSKQTDAMSELAPTVDMTIWEDTIGQGLQRLEAFGKVFGDKLAAAALKADFEAKLDAAKAAVSGQGKAMIVMTNGPKVSAYGASGRFGWLHKALEMPEAVAEVEQATHGEAISFEFIRDANPDILIVIDRLSAIGRQGEAAAATLDNALVRETTAWTSGKVIYLDSAPIYIAGGGIQSLNLTLDQFIAAFSKG